MIASNTFRVICLAVTGSGLAVSGAAHAQAFPTQTMRMVVPFSPGGNTDILARALGDGLSKNLGQTVVIDNRAGAGGSIGSAVVAKAPPDGHTILMVSASHVINPSIRKLPYDAIQDFSAISLVANVPTVMVVYPGVPAKTVKEFVALAEKRPGELNFGSAGTGTIGHLAGELFKSAAGIETVHVPYKGNAPAVADLLGGHTQHQFSSLPSVLPHIQSGKLRGIAMAAASRSSAAPAIPTMEEAGLPGVIADSGFGLLAPAGTPRDRIKTLNAAVVQALKASELAAQLSKLGADPVGNTPEEHDAFIRSEIAKWAKVVEKADITID